MSSATPPRRSTWRSRLRGLIGVATLAATLAGCAADEAPGDESTASAAVEGNAADALRVPTSASPSSGTDFTFCDRPGPNAPMNLTNAAWLAMISANEYASFGFLAPQLLSLGFGHPQGGDVLWSQCALDFTRIRTFEVARAAALATAKAGGPGALVAYMRRPENNDPSVLGVCARSFFAEQYTGRDASGAVELPTAAFKQYLLRETSDKNWIQFYTGKPYSFVERLVGVGTTQVMIARHATKPILIVAFRGTEAPESITQFTPRHVVDLVTDVLAWKTDLTSVGFSPGWGSAHNGWVSALQSVDDLAKAHDDLLTAKIRALTDNDDKVGIWVTGHSLGGAIATLLGARLLDAVDHGAKFNVRGIYTFGSPIVGNNEFADKLLSRAAAHGTHVVRFRSGDDVVTSVPFSPLGRYRHAGTLGFFDGERLNLLPKEPGYSHRNFDDHSLLGTSGYYQRILRQIKSPADPALNTCLPR